MKAISLFSGVGGFDLGFERAGIETAYQCEQDKHCRGVLSRHFPGVPIGEDIRDLRGKALPAADVLCGGFPCQDLSVAGRRAGLAGERSGLFYEFARLADETHTEWLVIENVPGLRSSNEGEDLEIVLSTLGKLGYVGGAATLDAQYFGVPQRRERVFIVGHLGTGVRNPIEVLFESESVRGDSPPSRKAGRSVAATLGGSSQNGGFRTTDLDGTTYIVAPFDGRGITSKANRSSVEDGAPSPTLHQGGMSVVVVQTNQTGRNGAGIAEDIAYTLDSTQGMAVYVPEIVGTLSDGAHHGGGLNGQDVYSGRIIARHRVRRLTPLECERVMGFPDGWTAGQKDTHRYKQLGNAVCPPVAEWIGHRLMEVHR